MEREFWRLIAKGLSTEAAATAVGVSVTVGNRWFRDGGGMATLELSEPTGRYLSMVDREEVAVLRGRVSVREIARRIVDQEKHDLVCALMADPTRRRQRPASRQLTWGSSSASSTAA